MIRLALSLVAIGVVIAAALALQMDRASAGTNLQEVETGNQSITVTWINSAKWNCAHIRFREENTSAWTVRTHPIFVSGGIHKERYEITGLTNGTTYEGEVEVYAARDSQNNCLPAWTKGKASFQDKTPSAVPETPSAPTLTVGNTELGVSWSAPADNGKVITDYDVQYSSDDGSTWTEWNASNTSTSTTATITGLTNGTSYQVRVNATNELGPSPWSIPATATPAAVPSAPSAPTLTVGNQRLGVSWTAPANNGSAITDYDVQHSSDGGSTWTEWNASNTSTSTTAAITGLTNGTSYQVQVRAANQRGNSPWSAWATATPATKPSKPAKPTLTVGNQRLSVSWIKPANNGSAITGFKVRHSSDGTNWTPTTISGGTTRSTTITGLTNGTSYQVQVLATNAIGDSDWSDSATATPAAAPVAPSLTAGDQQLVVSWVTPAGSNATITGFEVRYSSDGTNWTTVTISGGGSTSTTITGLTNGTSYHVQVRAKYQDGTYSPWSSSAVATLPETQGTNSRQSASAGAYYEIVLRGAVERVSTEDDPDPLTLYFPTRYYLSDCDDSDDEADPDCASLTFPDGVYEGLDEAVSETVRKNIWGAYVVTDEVGTAKAWERRFRAWLDTKRLGFALDGQRYFALSGRAVFDLDLWIIYFMAERGMNSVRLAERPFEPMLTVCLPRPRSGSADAIVAVWDYQEWRWQPLESVASLDEGQICALTPFVTEFSLVAAESVSELAQIP